MADTIQRLRSQARQLARGRDPRGIRYPAAFRAAAPRLASARCGKEFWILCSHRPLRWLSAIGLVGLLAASVAGKGTQELLWPSEGGRWTIVVMNADAHAGVTADVSVGAKTGILLPIGISFFTFHGISYVVDVYRRKIPAERNLDHFLLFILFFPHLVAGPIVRASDFLPQIKRPKHLSWPRFAAVPVLLVAANVVDAVSDPPLDYMLNCQGCHRADGAGTPGTVPALAGSVGRFLAVRGGREFLVQVPGVAQSILDDEITDMADTYGQFRVIDGEVIEGGEAA